MTPEPKCCYIHRAEDTVYHQALCRFVMASDPSPVDDITDQAVTEYLDDLASEYGFTSWVELFHADLSMPASEMTHAARLSCKLAATFVSNDLSPDGGVVQACERHAGMVFGTGRFIPDYEIELHRQRPDLVGRISHTITSGDRSRLVKRGAR